MDKNYDAISFISKYLYFKKAGVVIFADIIKVVTYLLKQSLKTRENLKGIEIMYQNAICICIS